MSIDIQKIEELLEAGKKDEARQLIISGVKEKLTDQEKGAALVDFASIYLEVSNSIQRKYKAQLEEVIAGLKKIKAAEAGLDDKVRIAELKKDLKK